MGASTSCEAAKPWCAPCTRAGLPSSANPPEYSPKTLRQELSEFKESGPPRSGEASALTDAARQSGDSTASQPASPRCMKLEDGAAPKLQYADIVTGTSGTPRRWTQQAQAVFRARTASLSSLDAEKDVQGMSQQDDGSFSGQEQERGGGSSSSHEYTVTLKKPGNTRLGADVDPQGSSLVVLEIVPGGLVQRWNDRNPETQIHTLDHIVEVNGVRGNVSAMAAECKKCGDVVLTLRRTKPNWLYGVQP